MNIETLAKLTNADPHETLIKVTKINDDHGLGIKDFSDLNRTQYDILRAILDTKYLVNLLKGNASGGRYNYGNAHNYTDLVDWVNEADINGCGISDMKELLPDPIKHHGAQTIAHALRAVGYTSRVVNFAEGKQGRRWFKEAVSFL